MKHQHRDQYDDEPHDAGDTRTHTYDDDVHDDERLKSEADEDHDDGAPESSSSPRLRRHVARSAYQDQINAITPTNITYDGTTRSANNPALHFHQSNHRDARPPEERHCRGDLVSPPLRNPDERPMRDEAVGGDRRGHSRQISTASAPAAMTRQSQRTDDQLRYGEMHVGSSSRERASEDQGSQASFPYMATITSNSAWPLLAANSTLPLAPISATLQPRMPFAAGSGPMPIDLSDPDLATNSSTRRHNAAILAREDLYNARLMRAYQRPTIEVLLRSPRLDHHNTRAYDSDSHDDDDDGDPARIPSLDGVDESNVASSSSGSGGSPRYLNKPRTHHMMQRSKRTHHRPRRTRDWFESQYVCNSSVSPSEETTTTTPSAKEEEEGGATGRVSGIVDGEVESIDGDEGDDEEESGEEEAHAASLCRIG
ncbi:uncharacterized protein EV422DRAFT_564108 [Fimicolochytrium jonesii]|uniref:uncharacterized protein n=1 Tax=Fimicolochytrium jonesii TaxID=1396493 RepID=UPI0022FE91B1|nr:uncharacterized protein EV422DRAFT_564108 [Fimicolochytrium jonesii]KAI8824779.1 hypothetical protein EV422DRAFT_564108 [Fimicolochytrium jonesii]